MIGLRRQLASFYESVAGALATAICDLGRTTDDGQSAITLARSGLDEYALDRVKPTSVGVLQRRDAVLVGDVDIRPMVYQQLHDLLMPGPAIAEHDRLQQRRPTQIVDMVDIHITVRQ